MKLNKKKQALIKDLVIYLFSSVLIEVLIHIFFFEQIISEQRNNHFKQLKKQLSTKTNTFKQCATNAFKI